MGRFESTVEFYARYREPYSPKFFGTVAQQVGFRGNEQLLDVGCGPGLLAIGLAPFVGQVTAIDPEAAMLEASEAAAAEAGANVSFIQGRLEQYSADRYFEVVTIGRALHWLDRDASLAVLESVLGEGGHILICGAHNAKAESASWVKQYEEVRGSYASGADEHRYKLDQNEWFAGSRFHQVDTISVSEIRQVSVPELIGRALSKSNTSPAVLGNRRVEFEADIRRVLEPFARNGILQEEIVSRATVFAQSRAEAATQDSQDAHRQ